MQQVKKGQTDLLGILFERHKNPLYNYFYRNTGHRVNSEDMVQTLFLRILKYRRTFDEDCSFTTWMYQIAHRLLIDLWRKSRPSTDIKDLPEQFISTNPVAEDDLVVDESLKLLNEALEQLNPDAREILVMSKYQGIKYSVIGDILGCTEGAVKVRIFRALQELKYIYNKLEGLK